MLCLFEIIAARFTSLIYTLLLLSDDKGMLCKHLLQALSLHTLIEMEALTHSSKSLKLIYSANFANFNEKL